MNRHNYDNFGAGENRTFDFELVLNFHLYSRPFGAVKMRLLATKHMPESYMVTTKYAHLPIIPESAVLLK